MSTNYIYSKENDTIIDSKSPVPTINNKYTSKPTTNVETLDLNNKSNSKNKTTSTSKTSNNIMSTGITTSSGINTNIDNTNISTNSITQEPISSSTNTTKSVTTSAMGNDPRFMKKQSQPSGMENDPRFQAPTGNSYVFHTQASNQSTTIDLSKDDLRNELRKIGLTDSDINDLLSGKKDFDTLLSEIDNDKDNTRRKYLVTANYLKMYAQALGLDFDGGRIEDLEYRIKQDQDKYNEMVTGKERNDDLHNLAMWYVLNQLAEGSDLDFIMEENILPYAYKWKDTNGNERYISLYANGEMKDDYIPKEEDQPVKLTDFLTQDDINEIRSKLVRKEKKHLFKDNEYLYVFDKKNKFNKQDEFVKYYEVVQDKMEGKYVDNSQEAKELYDKIEKEKYLLNYTKERSDYYMDNIDIYTHAEDFKENSSYNKNSSKKVEEHMEEINKTYKTPKTKFSLQSPEEVMTYYVNDKEEFVGMMLGIANGEYKYYKDGDYDCIKGLNAPISSLNDMQAFYLGATDILTDEEIKIFNYRYNKGGTDGAYDYLKEIYKEIDDRWYSKQVVEQKEYAKNNKILSSIGSVFLAPVEGMGSIYYSISSQIKNEPIYRHQVISNSDLWRQGVSEYIEEDTKAGEVGSFFYNTGMSMADSASLLAMNYLTGGTASLAMSAGVMGSRVYASTLNEALDRGLDDQSAIKLATANAIVESAMENYSMGHLMNLEGNLSKSIVNQAARVEAKHGVYAAKAFSGFAMAISQGITEAEEEGATEIVDYLADVVISKDLSNFNTSVNNYISNGKKEEEAISLTLQDLGKQTSLSALGGFVSGLGFGGIKGGKTVYNISNDIKNGKVNDYETNIVNKDSYAERLAALTEYEENLQKQAKEVNQLQRQQYKEYLNNNANRLVENARAVVNNTESTFDEIYKNSTSPSKITDVFKYAVENKYLNTFENYVIKNNLTDEFTSAIPQMEGIEKIQATPMKDRLEYNATITELNRINEYNNTLNKFDELHNQDTSSNKIKDPYKYAVKNNKIPEFLDYIKTNNLEENFLFEIMLKTDLTKKEIEIGNQLSKQIADSKVGSEIGDLIRSRIEDTQVMNFFIYQMGVNPNLSAEENRENYNKLLDIINSNSVIGIHRVGAMANVKNFSDKFFNNGIILTGHLSSGTVDSSTNQELLTKLSRNISFFESNANIENEDMSGGKRDFMLQTINGGLYKNRENEHGAIMIVSIPQEVINDPNNDVIIVKNNKEYLNPKYILGYADINNNYYSIDGFVENPYELYDSKTLPLSNETERRIAQEKMLRGESLTQEEQLKYGNRDRVVTEIDGYKLKSDRAYRAISKEAYENYLKYGYIFGSDATDENYKWIEEDGEHENNKGVDWYLGGAALKYGEVIIEVPADTKYFDLAYDNGTHLAQDVNVRHIKSSGYKNPIPMDMVRVVKHPDMNIDYKHNQPVLSNIPTLEEAKNNVNRDYLNRLLEFKNQNNTQLNEEDNNQLEMEIKRYQVNINDYELTPIKEKQQTQDRINELINKNNLTIEEQDELNRLQQKLNNYNQADEKIAELEQSVQKQGYDSIEEYRDGIKSKKEIDKNLENHITLEARNKVHQAVKNEPTITADMKSLETPNAVLIGEDNRIKTVDSTTEKIITNYLNEVDGNNELSYEEKKNIISRITDDLGDALRYTMVIDKDNYSNKVVSSLKELLNKGYKVKIDNETNQHKLRNYWDQKKYKGVNVTLISPNGLPVEMQFHTDESYRIKNGHTHLYYEIERNLPKEDLNRRLADEIQEYYQESVQTPTGLENITIDNILNNENVVANTTLLEVIEKPRKYRTDTYIKIDHDYLKQIYDLVCEKSTLDTYQSIKLKEILDENTKTHEIKSEYFYDIFGKIKSTGELTATFGLPSTLDNSYQSIVDDYNAALEEYRSVIGNEEDIDSIINDLIFKKDTSKMINYINAIQNLKEKSTILYKARDLDNAKTDIKDSLKYFTDQSVIGDFETKYNEAKNNTDINEMNKLLANMQQLILDHWKEFTTDINTYQPGDNFKLICHSTLTDEFNGDFNTRYVSTSLLTENLTDTFRNGFGFVFDPINIVGAASQDMYVNNYATSDENVLTYSTVRQIKSPERLIEECLEQKKRNIEQGNDRKVYNEVIIDGFNPSAIFYVNDGIDNANMLSAQKLQQQFPNLKIIEIRKNNQLSINEQNDRLLYETTDTGTNTTPEEVIKKEPVPANAIITYDDGLGNMHSINYQELENFINDKVNEKGILLDMDFTNPSNYFYQHQTTPNEIATALLNVFKKYDISQPELKAKFKKYIYNYYSSLSEEAIAYDDYIHGELVSELEEDYGTIMHKTRDEIAKEVVDTNLFTDEDYIALGLPPGVGGAYNGYKSNVTIDTGKDFSDEIKKSYESKSKHNLPFEEIRKMIIRDTIYHESLHKLSTNEDGSLSGFDNINSQKSTTVGLNEATTEFLTNLRPNSAYRETGKVISSYADGVQILIGLNNVDPNFKRTLAAQYFRNDVEEGLFEIKYSGKIHGFDRDKFLSLMNIVTLSPNPFTVGMYKQELIKMFNVSKDYFKGVK